MLKLSRVLSAILSFGLLIAAQPSIAAATAPYTGSALRDMPTILDITGRYGVKMGGGHFLTSTDGKQETYPRETLATTSQVVAIPSGAVVRYAFIYYGGSIAITDSEGTDYTADKVNSGTQADGLNTLNDVKGNGLTFKINGTQYTYDVNTRQPSGQSSVGSSANLSAQTFAPKYGTLTGTKTSFWSNRLDITGLMQGKTGNVTFEVSPPERLDVNANSASSNGGNPAGTTLFNACMGQANWAVVVVYEDASQPQKEIIVKDDIVRAWDYMYIHKGVWERPQIKFTHNAMQTGAKFYVVSQSGSGAGAAVNASGTCSCGCGGTYYLKKTSTAGTDKSSQYWSNTLIDPSNVSSDPAHRDKTNGPWTLTQNTAFGSTVKSGNDWTLFQSGSKFTEFPNLYEGKNQAADGIEAVTNENNADATTDKAGHPWGGRGTVNYHGWGNGLTAVEVTPDAANLTVGSTETNFYFKGDQKDVFKPQQLVWLRMLALEIPIASAPGSGVAPVVGSVTATPSGSSVTVSGSASDADNDLSKVEVEFDGNGTWLQASGTTSWTLTKSGMSAGSHSVRARATDSAGNVSALTSPVNFTISSFACTATTASNNAHVTAGRATTSGGYAYAKGSGTNMGLNNTFTTATLAETSSGYFIVGNCP